jgi:hypothetical protein
MRNGYGINDADPEGFVFTDVGTTAKVDFDAGDRGGFEIGTAFGIVVVAGSRYAAPFSELPKDRNRAIKEDRRTLDDFRVCPTGDDFGAAVWGRSMDEGEAQMSGFFPTRQEVLEGRGEWPTKEG